ncbi:hypothetical protein FOPE_04159 [Fonsecaea pedrosoi]|nr:hypothetical protein FOPE_04159 [Fonsecaea pedrosoi]
MPHATKSASSNPSLFGDWKTGFGPRVSQSVWLRVSLLDHRDPSTTEAPTRTIPDWTVLDNQLVESVPAKLTGIREVHHASRLHFPPKTTGCE